MEFAIASTAGGIDFSQEQMAQLWAHFVLTPACEAENRLFLQCLMRQRESGNG